MNDKDPAIDALVEKTARATAQRLAPKHGDTLETDVYAALYARDEDKRPDQYFDPITLGSLIVSIASLAWTIYRDQRSKTPNPSKVVIARRIRVELPPTTDTPTAQRDEIIDIVMDDITNQDPDSDKKP